MPRPAQEVTTTTYAVLGLLCVRSWSAYELTQQMARSMRFIWPRAESGIYREPRKLVRLGYAKAEEAPAGPRRVKTVYVATPAGRRALREWLRSPSAPPQFESEAVVKFFFADQGNRDDARRALDELSDHARTFSETFRAITASYEEGSGPFPERLHIGSLIGRLFYQYAQTLAQWAQWAAAQVVEWPGTGEEAAGTFGQRVQDENALLARRLAAGDRG
jgi:DNA-binding PadR family transcriptional regulator